MFNIATKPTSRKTITNKILARNFYLCFIYWKICWKIYWRRISILMTININFPCTFDLFLDLYFVSFFGFHLVLYFDLCFGLCLAQGRVFPLHYTLETTHLVFKVKWNIKYSWFFPSLPWHKTLYAILKCKQQIIHPLNISTLCWILSINLLNYFSQCN